MDWNAIPPNLELDETFAPTPPGLSYTSTAQALKDALEQRPPRRPHGQEISATILPGLTRFYSCQVHEAHPEYNMPEDQYYVDKACWEWCYQDSGSIDHQPFPGICPYTRSEKYLAVLYYEARLMPKFGEPLDPTPPNALPHREGNPWIHYRRVVQMIEEMWYDQDCILRQNQGQEPQDLAQIRSAIPRNKPDKWMSLRNAVQMLHTFVEYRDHPSTQMVETEEAAIMPDFYDMLMEQVETLQSAAVTEAHGIPQ